MWRISTLKNHFNRFGRITSLSSWARAPHLFNINMRMFSKLSKQQASNSLSIFQKKNNFNALIDTDTDNLDFENEEDIDRRVVSIDSNKISIETITLFI